MKKIKFIGLLIVMLFGISLTAQVLNSYKYVSMPKTFKFLDTEDEYKLNSFAKFLFEKENFIVLFNDDKLPLNLYNNPCLGLKLDLIKNKNFFLTSLSFNLIDCNKKIIFTSSKGHSKLKDYKRSYHEAFREAFISIKQHNYNFKEPKNISEKNIKTLNLKKIIKKPEVIKNPIELLNKENAIIKNDSQILYAQKTNNGFELVNNKPEIKYILINAGLKNVFHLKNKNGIIYKKNNIWYLEINSEKGIKTKKLNIKF